MLLCTIFCCFWTIIVQSQSAFFSERRKYIFVEVTLNNIPFKFSFQRNLDKYHMEGRKIIYLFFFDFFAKKTNANETFNFRISGQSNYWVFWVQHSSPIRRVPWIGVNLIPLIVCSEKPTIVYQINTFSLYLKRYSFLSNNNKTELIKLTPGQWVGRFWRRGFLRDDQLCLQMLLSKVLCSTTLRF